MRDYIKISFDTLNGFNVIDYVKNKLKEGHTVIQVLIDEDASEILELISYANDKSGKSYYDCFMSDKQAIEDYVIVERMEPYYAFKDINRLQNSNDSFCTADIDIQSDSQNVISFDDFETDFNSMRKHYNGESFKYLNSDLLYHYEFFISKAQCDIANFGGPMELDFIEQWMIEKGIINKNN